MGRVLTCGASIPAGARFPQSRAKPASPPDQPTHDPDETGSDSDGAWAATGESSAIVMA